MKNKKHILSKLIVAEIYAEIMRFIDKWNLQDKNYMNREEAIEQLAMLKNRLEVLKWIREINKNNNKKHDTRK